MAEAYNFRGNYIKSLSVTMLDETDITPVIDVTGVTIKTIYIPASFAGTKITVEVSPDGDTFFPYYNINNGELSVDISPFRSYGLGAIDFLSIRFCKFKSDVEQTADRIIIYDVISI